MTARRGWPSYSGCLIPLGTALLLLLVLPYSFLALLFWAADGSWDFEGRDGVRYWVFVKGSRLDRLGLVSPDLTTLRYSVSLQEGNFPGWRVLSYQSTDVPEAIVATYAKRCREMGLKVTKGPEPQLMAARKRAHHSSARSSLISTPSSMPDARSVLSRRRLVSASGAAIESVAQAARPERRRHYSFASSSRNSAARFW